MYHGTPAERAELRRTVMLQPGSKPKPKAGRKPTKTAKPTKKKPQTRNRGKQSMSKGDAPLRRSGRLRKSVIVIESDDDDVEGDEPYRPEDDDDDEELEVMDVDSPAPAEEDDDYASFPIVLTTYEMIIKDRTHLSHYDWGYIVVDEGHRLKNLDCKLMQEIKKYKSAGRMILTGTPLHVQLFFFFIVGFLLLIPDYF